MLKRYAFSTTLPLSLSVGWWSQVNSPPDAHPGVRRAPGGARGPDSGGHGGPCPGWSLCVCGGVMEFGWRGLPPSTEARWRHSVVCTVNKAPRPTNAPWPPTDTTKGDCSRKTKRPNFVKAPLCSFSWSFISIAAIPSPLPSQNKSDRNQNIKTGPRRTMERLTSPNGWFSTLKSHLGHHEMRVWLPSSHSPARKKKTLKATKKTP